MAKQWTIDELKEAAVALKELGFKHDPASTASTWSAPHGPQGLFSTAGVRPDMYSTIPNTTNDFISRIPMVASRLVNEVREILTGITATADTRAADVCSEGPMAGRLKVGRINSTFGTMKVDTEVRRLPDMGRRVDYADLDRSIINGINLGDNPFMPDVPIGSINTEMGKAFTELALSIKASAEYVDVVGVAGAGSNAAYLNLWIEQYDGLDRLIKTGHTDVSGVAMEAADSIITTHNAAIGSNGTNGVSFTENMVDTYYGLTERARVLGFPNVQWAVVMNPKTWRAVAYQWACTYYTDRCGVGTAGLPIVQDATAITQARDEMMRNRVLMIDGEPVEVLLSTGIETPGTGNNTFNSDIFFVPLTYGGRPLLYRQYFPMNNPDAQAFLALENDARVINNGLYAVGKRSSNGLCTKFEFVSKQRLILDAPFLAGRVNDVQFTYRAQSRDVRVGESLYKNGGQSSRP